MHNERLTKNFSIDERQILVLYFQRTYKEFCEATIVVLHQQASLQLAKNC